MNHKAMFKKRLSGAEFDFHEFPEIFSGVCIP